MDRETSVCHRNKYCPINNVYYRVLFFHAIALKCYALSFVQNHRSKVSIDLPITYPTTLSFNVDPENVWLSILRFYNIVYTLNSRLSMVIHTSFNSLLSLVVLVTYLV